MHPHSLSKSITLGPMLGNATKNRADGSYTARVVFETLKDQVIHVQLSDTSCRVVHRILAIPHLETHVLHILKVTYAPVPDAILDVTLCDDCTIHIPRTEHSTQTIKTHFLSCDGEHTKEYNTSSPVEFYSSATPYSLEFDSLWERLNATIAKDGPSRVFHIGDQVYMDDVVSAVVFAETPKTQAEMMAMIGEFYRAKFNKPFRHCVLKSAFNVMMWDDHEVVNTYRTVLKHNARQYELPADLEPLLISAYHYYQRSLYEDPDAPSNMPTMHVQMEDAQFIIPDLVAFRKLADSPDAMPIMGEAQFNHVKSLLDNPERTYAFTGVIFTEALIGTGRLGNYILTRAVDQDWLSQYGGTHTRVAEFERTLSMLMATDPVKRARCSWSVVACTMPSTQLSRMHIMARCASFRTLSQVPSARSC